jgi:hypothetical protein
MIGNSQQFDMRNDVRTLELIAAIIFLGIFLPLLYSPYLLAGNAD